MDSPPLDGRQWNFSPFVQILAVDMSVAFEAESNSGSGCTTTGSSEGKGRPGQEVHHGIAAAKNERGVWEREKWREWVVWRFCPETYCSWVSLLF